MYTIRLKLSRRAERAFSSVRVLVASARARIRHCRLFFFVGANFSILDFECSKVYLVICIASCRENDMETKKSRCLGPFGCAFVATLFLIVFGTTIGNHEAMAAVHVRGINGTRTVELESNDTVLTCDFDFDDNEKNVEVKWFFNQTQLIYQWLPDIKPPIAVGPFADIMEVDNTSIRFSTIFRNMSGEYTCKVSSDDDDQSHTESMVVYDNPIATEFFLEAESETVICSVYEAYPLPNITIFGTYVTKKDELLPVEKNTSASFESVDNCFNITKTLVLDLDVAVDSIEFRCVVSYPGTDFSDTFTYLFEYKGNDSSPTQPPPPIADNSSIIALVDAINESTLNSTNHDHESTTSTFPGGSIRLTATSLAWTLVLVHFLVANLSR